MLASCAFEEENVGSRLIMNSVNPESELKVSWGIVRTVEEQSQNQVPAITFQCCSLKLGLGSFTIFLKSDVLLRSVAGLLTWCSPWLLDRLMLSFCQHLQPSV